MSARYLVGIDLGTTNSALAFIDTEEKPRRVRDFPLVQLVGAADVAARPTLASVHHRRRTRAAAGIDAAAVDRIGSAGPILSSASWRGRRRCFCRGVRCCQQKSWLCHPKVDRLAAILPWGGAADVPRLSPVDVSARYLAHMLSAFCHARGCTLQDIDLTLTVPASFDEVARELTVEAARRAALPLSQLQLLEEPQAAFYHWLSQHARLHEEVEVGRPDLRL